MNVISDYNSIFEEMSIFGSTRFDSNNRDLTDELITSDKMLDYMVLVLSREMSCKVAFKGGYMLNQLLTQSSLTYDIDLSVAKIGGYEEIKLILEDIAKYFKKQNLIKSYKIKDSITATMSGGIDMYDIDMYDIDGKKIIGANIGLQNIAYGINHYKLKITELDGFSPERMCIDKLLVILSSKRFRRTKDLYDLYVITNVFDLDIELLYECIESRENYDPSIWGNIPFSQEILIQYESEWNKLRLVPYNKKFAIEKPAFAEVLIRFNSIASTLKQKTKSVFWDHVTKSWRKMQEGKEQC